MAQPRSKLARPAKGAVPRSDESSTSKGSTTTAPKLTTLGQFSHEGQTYELLVHTALVAPSTDDASHMLAAFPWGPQTLCIRLISSVAEDPLMHLLTQRERQVVVELAKGMRNKQIAWQLTLSEFTVAAYVKQICHKLQVHNRTALVSRCAELRAQSRGVSQPL